MIDVNDLKEIDCKKARDDLEEIGGEEWYRYYLNLEKFIDQVEALQRKYTKPVAALLKGPNG